MLTRPLFLAVCLVAGSVGLGQTTAPARLPKPQFQGDYFGDMIRSFAIVREVDPKARTLTVQREKDGKTVVVPIHEDTELRFRDAWGELSDYFPGQRVMLFMYVDEDRNWTYPRAVQDEIQVSALHGWFAAVTAIDPAAHVVSTHRDEKDKNGKITKSIDKQFSYDPAVKVWKDATPGGIDSLKVGDEVIQQQVEKEGKLLAVEILDRKGDAAVRAQQEIQHRKDQDRLGLEGYVTDVEVLTGKLTATVRWGDAERATQLKPGDAICITPADGRDFEAVVLQTERVDVRQRVNLAINAHVAGRLAVGQSLRLFLPGSGPALPTGKSAVPAAEFK